MTLRTISAKATAAFRLCIPCRQSSPTVLFAAASLILIGQRSLPSFKRKASSGPIVTNSVFAVAVGVQIYVVKCPDI
jgi:hypothetical protein